MANEKKIVINISKAAYKNLVNMALDHDTRVSTYLTEQIEKKFGATEEKEEPKPTSRKRMSVKRDEEAEQE